MSQVPRHERCAARSGADAEQLAGTAAHVARGYLCVEDPGPWGRSGIVDCSLFDIGVQLDKAASAVGLSTLVFRPTVPHRTNSRRVFAARHVGDRAMVAFSVPDVAELLTLNLSAYDGDLTAIHPSARLETEPLALVCTHAKRDQCCAIEGRPIAASLTARHRDRAFECSHLGGHRFAPTAIMLPLGAVYGRLSPGQAVEAMERARDARLLPEAMRGRSDLAPHEQAADVHLRMATGLDQIDDVAVTTIVHDGDRHTVQLVTRDGRWIADVESNVRPPTPLSCGAPPGQSTSHIVHDLRLA